MTSKKLSQKNAPFCGQNIPPPVVTQWVCIIHIFVGKACKLAKYRKGEREECERKQHEHIL